MDMTEFRYAVCARSRHGYIITLRGPFRTPYEASGAAIEAAKKIGPTRHFELFVAVRGEGGIGEWQQLADSLPSEAA